jgi:hypothetical protein
LTYHISKAQALDDELYAFWDRYSAYGSQPHGIASPLFGSITKHDAPVHIPSQCGSINILATSEFRPFTAPIQIVKRHPSKKIQRSTSTTNRRTSHGSGSAAARELALTKLSDLGSLTLPITLDNSNENRIEVNSRVSDEGNRNYFKKTIKSNMIDFRKIPN